MNEKMLVNAAMTRLIKKEGDWKAEARTVIEYAYKLPISTRVTADIKLSLKKPGDPITGHAEGHGDVELKPPDNTVVKHGTLGFKEDRIGDYRLWRTGPGAVRFYYFWESDAATQGPNSRPPEKFFLGHDPETLQPRYLAVERQDLIFRIEWLRFSFFKFYLDSIHGNAPRRWSTGFEIG